MRIKYIDYIYYTMYLFDSKISKHMWRRGGTTDNISLEVTLLFISFLISIAKTFFWSFCTEFYQESSLIVLILFVLLEHLSFKYFELNEINILKEMKRKNEKQRIQIVTFSSIFLIGMLVTIIILMWR